MKGTIMKAILPLLLLAAGIGYAGYIKYGYVKGQLQYEHLQEKFTRPYDTNAEPSSEAAITEDDREMDMMTDKTIWKPLVSVLPEDAPPRFSVDWDELCLVNEDLVAWISVPAVDISYPVLQGEDNEYYLHRDINRDYLFAGSIFMDAYNSPTFYNYNTIIYGHNMRDGSMFARLKDFSSVETYEKCKYFWIMTPGADLLYEICSIHPAATGSDTFMVRFGSYDIYKSWQDKMLSISSITTGTTLEYQDRIVTLSTCTEDSTTRMTVQGELIWKSS